GNLVKNYIDILSADSSITLIPLSKENYTDSFDIIHFTCPPVINANSNDEIYEEIKFIKNECIKMRNAKILVTTVYDIIPHIFKNVYQPSQIYYDEIQLLHQMDLIIAISSSTKNDLIKFFGIPEEKIYVIYPPLRISSL